MVFKWCVVPRCTNTSIKTPQKLFVSVPTNCKRRRKWLQLARRDPDSILSHSNVFMCEDHFNMEIDTINYMKYKMGFSKKILLADKAVPTKFYCQEDRKRGLSNDRPSRKTFIKRQRHDLVKECLQSQNATDVHDEGLQKVNIIEDIVEPKESSKTQDRETIIDPIMTAEKSVQVTTKVNMHYRSKAVQKRWQHKSISTSPFKSNDEVASVVIKNEFDDEDFVSAQDLDLEHRQLRQDVQVQEDDFVIEEDTEMHEVMIKEELDIGPTVLQPRIRTCQYQYYTEDLLPSPRSGTSFESVTTPAPAPLVTIVAQSRAYRRIHNDHAYCKTFDNHQHSGTATEEILLMSGNDYVALKTAKTNAENCKNYRRRKEIANAAARGQQGVLVKRKRTAAERARAYRLRKKIMSQKNRSSVNETSSVLFDRDVCAVGSWTVTSAVGINSKRF